MKDYQFTISPRKTRVYHLSDIGGNMMISVCDSYWSKRWKILIYDKITQIATVVIEEGGHINGFPGIIEEDLWKNEYKGGRFDYASYRVEYEVLKNGGVMIIYTLQPDGRYWEDDDGFGAENEVELNFFSYIDHTGKFTQPFKIYSIDLNQVFDPKTE